MLNWYWPDHFNQVGNKSPSSPSTLDSRTSLLCRLVSFKNSVRLQQNNLQNYKLFVSRTNNQKIKNKKIIKYKGTIIWYRKWAQFLDANQISLWYETIEQVKLEPNAEGEKLTCDF